MSVAPSEVSQLATEPWPTETETSTASSVVWLDGGIEEDPGAAREPAPEDDAMDSVAGAGAVALAAPDDEAGAPGGEAGVGCVEAPEDGAPSGTLGPSLIPAIRGQATPMTNPIAAITPTFLHEG